MKKCKIYGTEIEFKKKVSIKKIQEVTKRIHEKPSKYSDFKNNSEASYHQFLKFLWIKFPTGEDMRLTEFYNQCYKEL